MRSIDWIYTDILQHLGDRPVQYEFAQDAADEIDARLSLGAFDNVCGAGRPRLVLTGHSKGGGQAQFAAAKTNLIAIVFNADLVNPVISDDDLLVTHQPLFARSIQSFRVCTGVFGDSLRPYIAYLTAGKVKDVRMTNDPIGNFLFRWCSNNLPHAPVDWLRDFLNCSANGHGIETIIRELEACSW